MEIWDRIDKNLDKIEMIKVFIDNFEEDISEETSPDYNQYKASRQR